MPKLPYKRDAVYDPVLYHSLEHHPSIRSLAQDDAVNRQFLHRFYANLYHIRRSYDQLYGGHPDADREFELLIGDLTAAFGARSHDLRKLDLERVASPDWLLSEKWVGMMLYVDRFAGNLPAFQDKIAYLEELGINLVHLMPLLQSPEGSNDGGYAVSDYRSVDARFGDIDDLRQTAHMLRSKGMLMALDMVMNHTSDEHAWAQEARKGHPQYKDYYYFYPDRNIPDQFEQNLPEVFPHSAPGNFTYIRELQQWVMTVFHNYQWDLNYRNPRVFREMLKVMLFLANLGVDILRLDAVAFTWKEMGTVSQNLPQAHTILQLFKACAQVAAPGVAFIAEAIVAPHEVIKYFGEGEKRGHECEVAYHATFMATLWEALATGEVNLLNVSIQDVPQKPDRTTWITYLRCHDDIGLGFEDAHIRSLGKDPYRHKDFLIDFYSGRFQGSTALGAPFAHNPKTGDARISGSLAALIGLEHAEQSGDQAAIERAIDKFVMLHGIMLSYGGLPMVYYGDETGTGNDHTYLENPDQSYDNRWMHRPIIDWKRAAKRQEEGTVTQRTFDALQKLILLRKASPEMADQNSVSVETSENPHIFAYLRWHPEGARTLVLANFHHQVQHVHYALLYRCGFDPIQVMDKLTGQQPQTYFDSIQMRPYQIYWLTDKGTFGAFQDAEEMKVLKEKFAWGR
ncbi:MAG: amylosucrase [Bacteroidota bacterium]